MLVWGPTNERAIRAVIGTGTRAREASAVAIGTRLIASGISADATVLAARTIGLEKGLGLAAGHTVVLALPTGLAVQAVWVAVLLRANAVALLTVVRREPPARTYAVGFARMVHLALTVTAFQIIARVHGIQLEGKRLCPGRALQSAPELSKAGLGRVSHHGRRPDAELGDTEERDDVVFHLSWLIKELVHANVHELRRRDSEANNWQRAYGETVVARVCATDHKV